MASNSSKTTEWQTSQLTPPLFFADLNPLDCYNGITDSFPCLVCRTDFSTPIKLSKHLETIHRVPFPAKCSKCRLGFAGTDALNKHLRICSKTVTLLRCGSDGVSRNGGPETALEIDNRADARSVMKVETFDPGEKTQGQPLANGENETKTDASAGDPLSKKRRIIEVVQPGEGGPGGGHNNSSGRVLVSVNCNADVARPASGSGGGSVGDDNGSGADDKNFRNTRFTVTAATTGHDRGVLHTFSVNATGVASTCGRAPVHQRLGPWPTLRDMRTTQARINTSRSLIVYDLDDGQEVEDWEHSLRSRRSSSPSDSPSSSLVSTDEETLERRRARFGSGPTVSLTVPMDKTGSKEGNGSKEQRGSHPQGSGLKPTKEKHQQSLSAKDSTPTHTSPASCLPGSVSNGRGRPVCRICRVPLSGNVYKTHLRVSHPYACPVCITDHRDNSGLVAHLRQAHGDWLDYPKRDGGEAVEERKAKLLKTLWTELPRCFTCKMDLFSWRKVEAHWKEKHSTVGVYEVSDDQPVMDPRDDKLDCTVCSLEPQTRGHFRTSHQFTCPFCLGRYFKVDRHFVDAHLPWLRRAFGNFPAEGQAGESEGPDLGPLSWWQAWSSCKPFCPLCLTLSSWDGGGGGGGKKFKSWVEVEEHYGEEHPDGEESGGQEGATAAVEGTRKTCPLVSCKKSGRDLAEHFAEEHPTYCVLCFKDLGDVRSYSTHFTDFHSPWVPLLFPKGGSNGPRGDLSWVVRALTSRPRCPMPSCSSGGGGGDDDDDGRKTKKQPPTTTTKKKEGDGKYFRDWSLVQTHLRDEHKISPLRDAGTSDAAGSKRRGGPQWGDRTDPGEVRIKVENDDGPAWTPGRFAADRCGDGEVEVKVLSCRRKRPAVVDIDD